MPSVTQCSVAKPAAAAAKGSRGGFQLCQRSQILLPRAAADIRETSAMMDKTQGRNLALVRSHCRCQFCSFSCQMTAPGCVYLLHLCKQHHKQHGNSDGSRLQLAQHSIW